MSTTDLNRADRLGQILSSGYHSQRFHAATDKSSFHLDKPLSERLLFTASNLRVLLGQDSEGSMAFICAPHKRDYALPTCVTGNGAPISAHPGMYYQTDVAMWYGRARYQIELEDGNVLYPGAGADTWYMDHFLPVTRQTTSNAEISVLSFAPVLEPGTPCGIPGAQLPGPSGALFVMHIKNNSNSRLRGRCKMLFQPAFVIRSEYDGCNAFEKDQVRPYHCEWERDIYTMWRPDATASLFLKDGVHNTDAQNPELYTTLDLEPGAAQTIECYVAVSPDKAGVAPALATLLQHDALEWMQTTARFWADRLGKFSCKIEDDPALGAAYRDMQLRSVLDNFNCLQTDENGRLLVHWQGAPSHNVGRFWGIDIEPTALSVLYVLPELGPCLLNYIARRNEPRFSLYTDHSTPIRVALLTIAGQYIRLTNDSAFFKDNPEILEHMRAAYQKLMDSRHGRFTLFSSRYSSDGIVFHRYDLGTNAKVFFALDGYRAVLRALGDPYAEQLGDTMNALAGDIRAVLTAQGPFGPQFTGGDNLGEGDDFYFRDGLYYYDGEDSSSCMMPVYGLLGLEDEAWRNYHRFARSLFATNFDPEMRALRWFFYGGAVDGTAYVSRLGGAVTREEMRGALTDMLECAVDLTGSLFWWPKGKNKRRCIARCSQGQGSWVFQGTRQWLGLYYDAAARKLTVCPRGLLRAYSYQGVRMGGGLFDVEYAEQSGYVELCIVNRNRFPVEIRVGIRPAGAGADGPIAWRDYALDPGQALKEQIEQNARALTPSFKPEYTEVKILGQDGVVFGAFGLQLPAADAPSNAFLLRFVLLSDKALSDVRLKLHVPDGFGATAKEPRVWATPPENAGADACVEIGRLPAYERAVLPFYVTLPRNVDAQNVWQNRHPFEYPIADAQAQLLFAPSKCPACWTLEATLRYTLHGQAYSRVIQLPFNAISQTEFTQAVQKLLTGR